MKNAHYLAIAIVALLIIFLAAATFGNDVQSQRSQQTAPANQRTSDNFTRQSADATTRSTSATNSPATTSRPISYTPESSRELITVDTPTKEQTISSPLQISGRARGSWFFEATAPVVLTDQDGRTIAEGLITTEADWMTEAFVPFTGSLEFSQPANIESQGTRGTVILQRANPSALPENDAAVAIPVRFSH